MAIPSISDVNNSYNNAVALNAYTVKSKDTLEKIYTQVFKLTLSNASVLIAKLRKAGVNVDLIRPGDIVANPNVARSNPHKAIVSRSVRQLSNEVLNQIKVEPNESSMSPTVNYAELTLEQKVQISNSPLVQRLAYIGRDDLVQQINGARTIGELTSMLQNIRAMNLDKESSRIVVNAAIGRARVILTAEHAVIVTLALLCAQGKKEEGNIDEARAVVKDVVAFSEFEQTVKSMSPNESNLSELNEVSKNNTELAAVIYDLDAKYNIGLDSATKAKLASIINEGGGTGVSNAMVFETSDVSQLNVLNRIMQAFRSLTEDVMKMLSDNRTEQNKLDQKAAENKSEETRIEKKQYEKKYLKKIADDRRELSKLESKLGQMIYATPEEADKVKNQIIANINKPRPIV